LNTAAKASGLRLSQSWVLRKLTTMSAEPGAPSATGAGGLNGSTLAKWPNTAGSACIRFMKAGDGDGASIRWPCSRRNGARISVPAAGRRQLDHGHVRSDAEELQ